MSALLIVDALFLDRVYEILARVSQVLLVPNSYDVSFCFAGPEKTGGPAGERKGAKAHGLREEEGRAVRIQASPEGREGRLGNDCGSPRYMHVRISKGRGI